MPLYLNIVIHKHENLPPIYLEVPVPEALQRAIQDGRILFAEFTFHQKGKDGSFQSPDTFGKTELNKFKLLDG